MKIQNKSDFLFQMYTIKSIDICYLANGTSQNKRLMKSSGLGYGKLLIVFNLNYWLELHNYTDA